MSAQRPTYHYWSKIFKTTQGKTLEECYQEYGTGSQYLNPFTVMEVIFLDEARSFGKSWVLRCFSSITGENIPVRLYEADKVAGYCRLNPINKQLERKLSRDPSVTAKKRDEFHIKKGA